MTYFLYNVAATLALPLGVVWLALRKKHRALLRRFVPRAPSTSAPPIWVQACSVGEINTARPIIHAMKRRWPQLPIVLTTSTKAGYDLVASLADLAPFTWFPFDHSLLVRRFIQRLKPRVLILVETELWPNVLRETRRHGVPVMVINGRLSDKHYPRYLRWRAWLRPIFAQLSAAAMQNQEYADRIRALGAPPTEVHVTGNTKFDGAPSAIDDESCRRLRQELGIGAQDPILIFGSTRPGDEALAVRCWRSLREAFPELRLIIAPRHVNRAGEVLALFDEPVRRRSEMGAAGSPSSDCVLLLDTLGELVSFYALADVAVVGGSFYPGVEGHNPLEPAAQGVPTVFGPYMRNFIDPARVLVEAGGACQVLGPDDLLAALQRLLADASARRELAACAQQAITANQGAIQRTLDLLERVAGLEPSGSSTS